MSRMSELEIEVQRLAELDRAVRYYLSHLAAFEQGSQHDKALMDHWREQLDLLTAGEPLEVE